MSHAERRSTPGPAGELSYLVWPSPSTATPILYLHPVNTAAAVWEAVADELGTGRQAVAVDYRAHGRSAAGGPYHPADYAADALAVLDACGIERAHVVCGSIGGAVAAELTAAAPGRVASIAAFGATLALRWPAETLDEVERDLRTLGVREWFVRHGAEILGPAARAEAEAELVAVAVAGRTGDRDLDTVVEVLRTTFGLADSRRVAAAIADPPPTRVFVGSHDPTCPPVMAQELAAALGGEVEVLPDIGHLPMLEDPSGTATAVRAFHTALDTERSASGASIDTVSP